jgi:hypothetical protein
MDHPADYRMKKNPIRLGPGSVRILPLCAAVAAA